MPVLPAGRYAAKRGYPTIQRFYWLVPGALAGCSRPGSGAREALTDSRGTQEALQGDLAWLRRQEIGAVLSLTETPLDRDGVAHHGLELLHLPVPDLTPPLPEQLIRALHFIDLQQSLGRATAVHCLMGQGRTGSVLGAYLIRRGMPPDEAIAQLRSICPGALSVEEQEYALHAFGARRDWVI